MDSPSSPPPPTPATETNSACAPSASPTLRAPTLLTPSIAAPVCPNKRLASAASSTALGCFSGRARPWSMPPSTTSPACPPPNCVNWPATFLRPRAERACLRHCPAICPRRASIRNRPATLSARSAMFAEAGCCRRRWSISTAAPKSSPPNTPVATAAMAPSP